VVVLARFRFNGITPKKDASEEHRSGVFRQNTMPCRFHRVEQTRRLPMSVLEIVHCVENST